MFKDTTNRGDKNLGGLPPNDPRDYRPALRKHMKVADCMFLKNKCPWKIFKWSGNPNSGVASPKIWGAKMFDFRRITLFCLKKRLSKHKTSTFSKNLGGHGPYGPPLLRVWTLIYHEARVCGFCSLIIWAFVIGVSIFCFFGFYLVDGFWRHFVHKRCLSEWSRQRICTCHGVPS